MSFKDELWYTLNDEVRLLVSNILYGLVENHIDAWSSRYADKTLKEISYDLSVNHDPSIEIEAVQDRLKRDLTDEEYEVIVQLFNESVLDHYR